MTNYNEKDLNKKDYKAISEIATKEFGVKSTVGKSKKTLIEHILKSQESRIETANSNKENLELGENGQPANGQPENAPKEEDKYVSAHRVDLTNVPATMVLVEKLIPSKFNLFKPLNEKKFNELKDSIKGNGVLNPIIVRIIPDSDELEILSGHNRVSALKALGKTEIQAKVVDVDDEKAKEIIVDANVAQRQDLSPMEIANAYKIKLDAVGSRQGQRTDKKGKAGATTDWIGQEYNVSGMTIIRYIRLTNLLPVFQEAVDKGELIMKAGSELGMADKDIQEMVLEYVGKAYDKITTAIATKIKGLSESRAKVQKEGGTKVVTNGDVEKIFMDAEEKKNTKESDEDSDNANVPEENKYTIVLPEISEEMTDELREEIRAYLQDSNFVINMLKEKAMKRLSEVAVTTETATA